MAQHEILQVLSCREEAIYEHESPLYLLFVATYKTILWWDK